jgi:hypothetical protein
MIRVERKTSNPPAIVCPDNVSPSHIAAIGRPKNVIK